MIRSMTGYGRGAALRDGFGFTVEIRSVNHRYADFILRMPRDIYFLEERVRRLLQAQIRRGRLEVAIILSETPPGSYTVAVNYELAEAYYRSLRELADRLSMNLSLGVEYLGSLQDVLCVQERMLDEQRAWPALEAALLEALEQLIRQRAEEGENLWRDLLERCRQVERILSDITARAPQVLEEHHRRLENKFSEYLSKQFDQNRILMECSLLVERMGINEELVRLKSHLDAFKKAPAELGPVGRKLDFIAQEMFREANTIGSKAGDYEVARLVVELKAELEKVREQIQNIE